MTEEDLDFFGFVVTDKHPPDEWRIYPCNQTAAALFYASGTQWRRDFNGNLMGLDYPAVESAARMSGIDITPTVFADLRLIEIGALGIRHELPVKDLNHVSVDFCDE